jgi:hypothetical protein
LQTYTLDSFVQKGFRIPTRGQAEIDHLAVCIDRPPQIALLAANPDVGLI